MYAYRHHLLPRLKGPGEATTVLTSPLPLPWRSVIGEATRNGSTPKMVGHGWFPKIWMMIWGYPHDKRETHENTHEIVVYSGLLLGKSGRYHREYEKLVKVWEKKYWLTMKIYWGYHNSKGS